MADLPALPDGLTVRPLRADDVTDAAALLEAAERVDDTGEHWSPEDLAEWWVNDLFDLERDSLVVRSAAGDLVAWATVLALPDFREAFRITLEARVHPDWRGAGLGARMLRHLEDRARELGHRRIHLDTNGTLVEAIAMYRAAGYADVARYNDNPYAEAWFAKDL